MPRWLGLLCALVLGAASLAGAQASLARLGPRAIDLATPITFETGTSTLDATSQGVLRAVVQILLSNPSVTVEVGSHTDDRGSSAYNLRMSQERADAVRDFLLAAGVASSRVTARGYGETRPIDGADTAAARSRNRRIELVRTDVP